MAGSILSCSDFTNFLLERHPFFDQDIIADIRPEDGWIAHVATEQMDTYERQTEMYRDRFRHVFPNVTKRWNQIAATVPGGDLGTDCHSMCDKTENKICWGHEREQYYWEESNWATDLLCFDADMHIAKAKEHYRQIISDILKPATSAIMSNFLRKKAAELAGRAWIANATMDTFTHHWVLGGADGDEEVFLDTTGLPTSKLTPQMLQRRVHPLMLAGYLGKNPFRDQPPLIELVTDMESLWELDHAAADGNVSGNWRFTDWGMAHQYYKYAFTGQLGNYVIRADAMPMRFNYIGRHGAEFRFQRVLPYENNAAGGRGLGSDVNDDYQNAQYQFSYIWHRKGLVCGVADPSPVNPEMPFSSRNFAGKWQFVMDNLGGVTDDNGTVTCVIENKRRNKGQFIADFKLAVKPMYTEFVELIFHKREPACVVIEEPCNDEPGYSAQNYESACDACAE